MGRLLVIKCVVASPVSQFKNQCGQNLGGVLGVRRRARITAEVPLSKLFNSQMLTSPIYSWDRLSILLLTPAGIKKLRKCWRDCLENQSIKDYHLPTFFSIILTTFLECDTFETHALLTNEHQLLLEFCYFDFGLIHKHTWVWRQSHELQHISCWSVPRSSC